MEYPANKSYTHILQKTGILRNFSIAKVVSSKEIEDLEKVIRSITKNEDEYKLLLESELTRLADMHNPSSPIPGIIYIENVAEKLQYIRKLAEEVAKRIRDKKMTKKESCYLIANIVDQLGLTQEDFMKLGEDDEQDA